MDAEFEGIDFSSFIVETLLTVHKHYDYKKIR